MLVYLAKSNPYSGKVRYVPHTKNGVAIQVQLWEETLTSKQLDELVLRTIISTQPIESFITAEGDSARVGSHVVFKRQDGSHGFAMVKEAHRLYRSNDVGDAILAASTALLGHVHRTLRLPILEETGELILLHPLVRHGLPHTLSILTASQDIKFIFNAQNDCYHHDCTLDGQEVIIEERAATTKYRTVVRHTTGNSRWVVNLYALHNHHQIKQYIPQHLLVRPYVVSDDGEHRIAAATALRKAAKKDKDLQDGKEEEKEMENEVVPEAEPPTKRIRANNVASRTAIRLEARRLQVERLVHKLGLYDLINDLGFDE
jgi:hypothetical protein